MDVLAIRCGFGIGIFRRRAYGSRERWIENVDGRVGMILQLEGHRLGVGLMLLMSGEMSVEEVA